MTIKQRAEPGKAIARQLSWMLAAGLTAIATPAAAQGNYPSSSIRMVYGYAPGGGGDAYARLLAAQLSAQMNASVIVDNKPVASGHISNESVAKSRPDGYTLLFNDTGVCTGPALGENLGYDLLRHLAPVALVLYSPYLLAVHPSVPANTIGEFIGYVRANPNKLAYGSGGLGTNNHLTPLLFLQLNGLSALHVPYKGSAPMMLDVVAGRVQWAMTGAPTILPLAEDKRINVLASGGLKRSPLLPEMPTLAESVTPGLEAGEWYGVMVAAQTPPALVKRLNAEILKALQDADLKSKLEQRGAVPTGPTPEDYAAYLKSDLERWTKVIKTAGIKLE